MDEPPKISAIVPYFGGKRGLAPEIVRELGEHGVYWEPFCGSMAVLFAKPRCAMETVNDLHGDLMNLARVLQDRELAAVLYGMLRPMLMHEGLFREAADRMKLQPECGLPDVGRACDFMVVSWIGRNGVTGTSTHNAGFCARFTANGGHAATRWTSAVDSIPVWHDRLRSVSILRRDAFEILPRIEDAAGTVIYCDPPYVEKGASYVHDFDDADHPRLAEVLGRFRRARVVVSYYDHPVVRDSYKGWTFRKLNHTKAMVHQGMRGKTGAVKAPEVLVMNGMSMDEGELFS